MTDKPKSKRGFASMTPEKRKELASKGGKAAHAKGKARHFTSQEAAEAGKKGGKKTAKDKKHMQEIGRLGGLAAVKSKKAHRWNSEEAKKARKKVGKVEQAVKGEEE